MYLEIVHLMHLHVASYMMMVLVGVALLPLLTKQRVLCTCTMAIKAGTSTQSLANAD
jgi:hypothetical protein